MLIDGDRLTEWLQLYRTQLADSGRNALSGETRGRFVGALKVLDSVQQNVGRFEHVPPKTPVSDIKASTKNKVRHNDPLTSFEAAVAASPEKSLRLYRVIQKLLSRASRTDDEILNLMSQLQIPHSESGVRTRRKELVDAGWVRDSGQKRASRSGHPSIVWELVPDVRR